ncbi:protein of unknown function [Pseudorhizobium banfieldiae]|uniref:Uncharacterized protein n=1 Tax=Pseudorhizobium banfieldiae TaxID=1125847 RepID=L0NHF4_9HYPH|nr:protein of unknown function [Pseudorhizobium banfieldiae]
MGHHLQPDARKSSRARPRDQRQQILIGLDAPELPPDFRLAKILRYVKQLCVQNSHW